MCYGWRYCNIKVPERVALMDKRADILEVIRILTGREADDYWEATTGSSPFEPYDEADVDFVVNGEVFALSYDYMLDGSGTARIFRSTLIFQGSQSA